MCEELPYIKRKVTRTIRMYNPQYGDDRVCVCGHSYYRHFDSFDDMSDCGCRYCDCETFVEATPRSSDGG